MTHSLDMTRPARASNNEVVCVCVGVKSRQKHRHEGTVLLHIHDSQAVFDLISDVMNHTSFGAFT